MKQLKKFWSDLISPAKWAIGTAVLGSLISLSSLSRSTVNGAETSCSYSDMGALGFGVAGVVAGAMAILGAPKSRNATINYAVGALGVLLGVLNIARGLGLVGGPCN